ncbi:MAG: 50S ribosomal protein L32 [Candidatus Promineifilaceae bacterium]|nr:50S ribosomal protein L32 [Candidatus Promineifilaceae bacterium]
MGAVPKRKISKSRRDKRRTHDKLDIPHLVVCPECGEMKRPHYMCDVCFTYTTASGKKIQVLPAVEE